MKNIFVSSTFEDLKEFRSQVVDSIRQLGLVDISMENFGARESRPKDECLRIIKEETTAFVGIYAHRYGYIPKGDKISITESEYNYAEKLKLPKFVYILDENAPWLPKYIDRDSNLLKLTTFKERLKTDLIIKYFSNKDDLASSVSTDLGRYFLQIANKNINSRLPQKELEISSPKNIEEWNKLRYKEYNDSQNIFLVHTLWPSDNPKQKYDIYLYLITHGEGTLDNVKHAEFFLGPYWKNKIFKVENSKNKIGIYTAAYGSFLCMCKIVFTDDSEIILYRYVDFEHGKLYVRK